MSNKTIRFNAGKVQFDEESKTCTPLPHKGIVSISANEDDDEFFDFLWSPKGNSGNIEKDELLIVPGDVSFKHVKSCKTGRVLALTFLSSGAKNLYWLQDVGDDDDYGKLTEKDKKIISDVNALISIVDEEQDEEITEEAKEAPSQKAFDATEKVVTSSREEHSQPTDISDFPIISIGDVLTNEAIERALSSLSDSEIKSLYSELIPSTNQPATVSSVVDSTQNAFFQQALAKLSDMLNNSDGAGYLLAQSLRQEYKGEGIDSFLASIRKSSREEDDDMKE